MKRYKLKNGKLIKYNGGFIVEDNRVFINPTEEKLRENGYKELVYDEQPEYDETTHYLVRDFEEQEDCNVVHWVVKEIEIEEKIVTEE